MQPLPILISGGEFPPWSQYFLGGKTADTWAKWCNKMQELMSTCELSSGMNAHLHKHTSSHVLQAWQHVVMQSGVCFSSWQTRADSMVRALQTREKKHWFYNAPNHNNKQPAGHEQHSTHNHPPCFFLLLSDAVSLWWLSNACFCVCCLRLPGSYTSNVQYMKQQPSEMTCWLKANQIRSVGLRQIWGIAVIWHAFKCH